MPSQPTTLRLEGSLRPEGSLHPKGYRSRLIDSRLSALLQGFGAVEIVGPKWCGKTWSAMTCAASMVRLIEETTRLAVEQDVSLALMGEEPHLIDEWQEVPEVWDSVRMSVDDGAGRRGRYLLTGSHALKKKERERIRHSGAGRIGRLKMSTMTLAELGRSDGSVSLKALFDEGAFDPHPCSVSMPEVARWCCRGGWPGALDLPDELAFEQGAQYIESVLRGNVEDEGLSADLARRFMRSLAFNVGQAATRPTLLKDAGMDEGSASQANVLDEYLAFFKRLYLIEEVGGWVPPMCAKTRVRTKPKRYFADPSLPAALLGTGPEQLVFDIQTLGLLFENLVMHDLWAAVDSYPGTANRLCFYRDDKDLEVDAIVEYGTKWAAIEIKLSDVKVDRAAESLLRLRRKVVENPAAQNPAVQGLAGQNPEPAFLAVVTGRSTMAYRRKDGVYVIPAACLTA